MFNHTSTDGTTSEGTDTKAMPRCSVEYENGDEWNKDNKSYSSFDLAYKAQELPMDGGQYPTKVRNYLDNIRTEQRLSILEEGEIKLGSGSLKSKFTTEDEIGTISLLAAPVEKHSATRSNKFPDFSQTLVNAPLGVIPLKFRHTNIWREAGMLLTISGGSWPALDKDCLPAQPPERPCVWKIWCPWEMAQRRQEQAGNGNRNV
ncbi:hypothetical protein B0H14DRAFT_2576561 [Mycena olivaceomarginata]|nr:hypothetical protein B0H14DRAFT_2576561 [Mycena olivaceomarginata]